MFEGLTCYYVFFRVTHDGVSETQEGLLVVCTGGKKAIKSALCWCRVGQHGDSGAFLIGLILQ